MMKSQDCVIKGVMMRAEKPAVIIGSKSYNEGDYLCGGVIRKITPRKVTVSYPDGIGDFNIGSNIDRSLVPQDQVQEKDLPSNQKQPQKQE